MQILGSVGFLTCSQARMFRFLEDVVHPIRRDHDEQKRTVAALNPILRRDGFFVLRRPDGFPANRERR